MRGDGPAHTDRLAGRRHPEDPHFARPPFHLDVDRAGERKLSGHQIVHRVSDNDVRPP